MLLSTYAPLMVSQCTAVLYCCFIGQAGLVSTQASNTSGRRRVVTFRAPQSRQALQQLGFQCQITFFVVCLPFIFLTGFYFSAYITVMSLALQGL